MRYAWTRTGIERIVCASCTSTTRSPYDVSSIEPVETLIVVCVCSLCWVVDVVSFVTTRGGRPPRSNWFPALASTVTVPPLAMMLFATFAAAFALPGVFWITVWLDDTSVRVVSHDPHVVPIPDDAISPVKLTIASKRLLSSMIRSGRRVTSWNVSISGVNCMLPSYVKTENGCRLMNRVASGFWTKRVCV